MDINEIKNKVTDSVKADPKKFAIKIGAIILAIIIVISLFSVVVNALTNTYKTPIKVMEKYDNAKKYYSEFDEVLDGLNGFAEKEYKAIFKIYKSTEDYKDNLEDSKEDFKDYIEDQKDEYGKNYKYTYKIVDKEKLEREDIKEFRNRLRSRADSYEAEIDRTDDYDTDDWEELADNMGLDGSKKKAKAYIAALKKLRKVYNSAKVTAGYELTVEIKLTGSELDEPEEEEREFKVFKVNGRWVAEDAIF